MIEEAVTLGSGFASNLDRRRFSFHWKIERGKEEENGGNVERGKRERKEGERERGKRGRKVAEESEKRAREMWARDPCCINDKNLFNTLRHERTNK